MKDIVKFKQISNMNEYFKSNNLGVWEGERSWRHWGCFIAQLRCFINHDGLLFSCSRRLRSRELTDQVRGEWREHTWVGLGEACWTLPRGSADLGLRLRASQDIRGESCLRRHRGLQGWFLTAREYQEIRVGGTASFPKESQGRYWLAGGFSVRWSSWEWLTWSLWLFRAGLEVQEINQGGARSRWSWLVSGGRGWSRWRSSCNSLQSRD